MVIATEVTGAQVVFAYPAGLRGKISHHLETLRPEIRRIVATNDLVSPIVRFARRYRDGNKLVETIGTPEPKVPATVEELRAELRAYLGHLIGVVFPGTDAATISSRAMDLSQRVAACRDSGKLERAKVLTLPGYRLDILSEMEGILHET
jgi:hypothetical protein